MLVVGGGGCWWLDSGAGGWVLALLVGCWCWWRCWLGVGAGAGECWCVGVVLVEGGSNEWW